MLGNLLGMFGSEDGLIDLVKGNIPAIEKAIVQGMQSKTEELDEGSFPSYTLIIVKGKLLIIEATSHIDSGDLKTNLQSKKDYTLLEFFKKMMNERRKHK